MITGGPSKNVDIILLKISRIFIVDEEIIHELSRNRNLEGSSKGTTLYKIWHARPSEVAGSFLKLMECSKATKLLTLIISDDDAVRFQLHFLNIALEKSIILSFS